MLGGNSRASLVLVSRRLCRTDGHTEVINVTAGESTKFLRDLCETRISEGTALAGELPQLEEILVANVNGG